MAVAPEDLVGVLAGVWSSRASRGGGGGSSWSCHGRAYEADSGEESGSELHARHLELERVVKVGFEGRR